MASTQTVMWNQNLWSLTFRRCLACQVLPEDSNRWSPDVTFEPNCLRRALCSYWQVGLATSSRSIQQDVSLNWKRCQDTLFSSENWKTEKQYETFEMKRLHAVFCLPRLSLSQGFHHRIHVIVLQTDENQERGVAWFLFCLSIEIICKDLEELRIWYERFSIENPNW